MDNEGSSRKVVKRMLEEAMVIKNETGIHARPASLIVKEAQKYQSDIMLVKKGNEYNCKSLMNMLSSGIKKDDEVLLRVKGSDEEEAIKAVGNLLKSSLDI